jgi:hypothetical protein
VNGPSITVRLPPSKRMRAPFFVLARPPVAWSTPALVISSMSAPIFATSRGSGGASLSERASIWCIDRKRSGAFAGFGIVPRSHGSTTGPMKSSTSPIRAANLSIHPIASSFERTRMSAKPATSSVASVKGPSVIVRLPFL